MYNYVIPNPIFGFGFHNYAKARSCCVWPAACIVLSRVSCQISGLNNITAPPLSILPVKEGVWVHHGEQNKTRKGNKTCQRPDLTHKPASSHNRGRGDSILSFSASMVGSIVDCVVVLLGTDSSLWKSNPLPPWVDHTEDEDHDLCNWSWLLGMSGGKENHAKHIDIAKQLLMTYRISLQLSFLQTYNLMVCIMWFAML